MLYTNSPKTRKVIFSKKKITTKKEEEIVWEKRLLVLDEIKL